MKFLIDRCAGRRLAEQESGEEIRQRIALLETGPIAATGSRQDHFWSQLQ